MKIYQNIAMDRSYINYTENETKNEKYYTMTQSVLKTGRGQFHWGRSALVSI